MSEKDASHFRLAQAVGTEKAYRTAAEMTFAEAAAQYRRGNDGTADVFRGLARQLENLATAAKQDAEAARKELGDA